MLFKVRLEYKYVLLLVSISRREVGPKQVRDYSTVYESKTLHIKLAGSSVISLGIVSRRKSETTED